MKRIDITKVFANDHITRAAGERLREIILDVTKDGDCVEIDFGGAVIASTSFLDEGFAKLAEMGWNQKKLRALIVFTHLHPRDAAVLDELFAQRENATRKS